ncbi:MAG: hypothetical protein IKU55_04385, partial [Clostridia bacterium]|nr:hypothetical protein [Clostridia bacterium]
SAIRKHIREYGVQEFVVGMYGMFDRLAARAVFAVKAEYPEIRLVLLLAYHPAERSVVLPPEFDGSVYPGGMDNVPKRLAIIRANQYMVEHADFVIAYVRFAAGGARKTLDYAVKRAVPITNLCV